MPTTYQVRQSPSGKFIDIVVPDSGGGSRLFSAYLNAVTASSWLVGSAATWNPAAPDPGNISQWAVDNANSDWSFNVATGVATYAGVEKNYLLSGNITAFTPGGGGGAIWAAFDVDGDIMGTARYSGARNTASGMDADGDLKGVALNPTRRLACAPGMVVKLAFSNPGAGCTIQLAQLRFTECT